MLVVGGYFKRFGAHLACKDIIDSFGSVYASNQMGIGCKMSQLELLYHYL